MEPENGGVAPDPSTPLRTPPAGDSDGDGDVERANLGASSLSALAAHHTPPRAINRARVDTLSVFSSQGKGSSTNAAAAAAAAASSGTVVGNVTEAGHVTVEEDKEGGVRSRTGSGNGPGNGSCSEHRHGGGGRGRFARRLLGENGMEVGGQAAAAVHGPGKRRAACGLAGSAARGGLGVQCGLPRVCDADALRHSLGFLCPKDLARFASASAAARDVVSTHASIEMCERWDCLYLLSCLFVLSFIFWAVI